MGDLGDGDATPQEKTRGEKMSALNTNFTLTARAETGRSR
jgi:hypothetical protein